MQLVEEGRLKWSDELDDFLGRGPDGLTAAALVTHTAGLGPDSTQDTMGRWLKSDVHQSAKVLEAVEGCALASEPGRYAYSSENYALLGLMIEAASGEGYRDACGARVFEPAGVDVPPPSRTEGFLPWGGWTMPSDDFAKLHAYWFGLEGAVGKDPFAQPHAEMGAGSITALAQSCVSFAAAITSGISAHCVFRCA